MEEGVVVANYPTNIPPHGFPFPLPYEPIVLPDNSTRVVGTSRDQATISLDRAILSVEAEPPNPFGQRVYIDTQATAEPKNAAMEQAITEQMTASRYEEGNAEPETPTTIEIQGTRAGGVVGPHQVVVPREITAITNKAFNDAQAVLALAQMVQLTPEQLQWVADFQDEVRALSTAMGAFDASIDAVRSAIDVRAWVPAAQSISDHAVTLGSLLQTATASTSGGVPWLLIGAAAVGAWLLLRK
jgi:hypothetical protein